MEAVKKELSPEERQANIDTLIEKIKASKKQIKEQIERDGNIPQIQAIIKRLSEEYAKNFRKTA